VEKRFQPVLSGYDQFSVIHPTVGVKEGNFLQDKPPVAKEAIIGRTRAAGPGLKDVLRAGTVRKGSHVQSRKNH